jgi:hypothetical protein
MIDDPAIEVFALYREALAKAEKLAERYWEQLQRANQEIGALRAEVDYLRKKRAVG